MAIHLLKKVSSHLDESLIKKFDKKNSSSYGCLEKGIKGYALFSSCIRDSFCDCGTWSEVEQISLGDHTVAYSNVSMNNSGNAFAVWTDTTFGDIISTYWNGSSWSDPESRSTGLPSSFLPIVSYNDNGKALLVWQTTSDPFAIYGVFYNGSAWTGRQKISTDGASSRFPQVVLSNDGTGIAVWQEVGAEVYAALFDGSSWGDPVAISPAGQTSESPTVAINESGIACITWINTDLGKTQTRFYNGSSFEDITTFTDSGSDPGVPRVAINSSGKALISWQNGTGVSAAGYNGSAWEVTVLNDESSQTPWSTLNDSNIGFVAWGNNVHDTIQVGRYTNGNWSTPEVVSGNVSSTSSTPEIQILDQNGALIVWPADVSTGYSAEFNGTEWGNIATFYGETFVSGAVSLSLNSQGSAIAVWISADGGESQTYAAFFTPTPNTTMPAAFMASKKNGTVVGWSQASGITQMKVYQGTTANHLATFNAFDGGGSFVIPANKAMSNILLQSISAFNQESPTLVLTPE